MVLFLLQLTIWLYTVVNKPFRWYLGFFRYLSYPWVPISNCVSLWWNKTDHQTHTQDYCCVSLWYIMCSVNKWWWSEDGHYNILTSSFLQCIQVGTLIITAIVSSPFLLHHVSHRMGRYSRYFFAFQNLYCKLYCELVAVQSSMPDFHRRMQDRLRTPEQVRVHHWKILYVNLFY